MAIWYDPDDWYGASRARSQQFFATDDDVLELFQATLIVEFAPYSIIAYRNVKVTDYYRHLVVETEIENFLSLRDEGFTQFFIRSKAISSGMDLSNLRFIDAFLATNGLLHLDHGSITDKLGWTPSNLGLAHRMVHRRTGETVTHHDYDKVFFALRRAVKKMVRYRAMRVLPSGEEIEERHIHMTEGFVAKLRSGEIKSAYYPGERL